MSKKLDEVGGWLAVLIYFHLILRPLIWSMDLHMSGIDTAAKLSSNIILQMLIVVVSITLSLLAAYRMLKERNAQSVRYTVATLWIAGPLAVLLYRAVLFLAAFEGKEITLTLPILGYFIRPTSIETIFALAWTLYLKRSKRVKKIYLNS